MDDRTVAVHSLTQLIDRMYPGSITKQDVTAMLHMLKRHRKISLKEIADLILYIADTSHREWNIEVILNSINEVFESINWRGVYEKFVEEDLKIWNTEYLYTLVDCWIHVSGIITVPYEVFFRKWLNRENQVDFLRILLESDEKRTQVYSNIFFEKIVTKEEIRSFRGKKTVEYESNLNSVELFKSIRDIGAVEIVDLIKGRSPEYCIMGLAAILPFCEDVFDDLFVFFCDGTTSSFVHHMLFAKHRTQLLGMFKRVSSRISLTRTLDIFLEHKMLPVVTELLEPKDLCFDIIILSSRRDHLNLEVWLNNNFAGCAGAFIDYFHSKLLCGDPDTCERGAGEPSARLRAEPDFFPFDKGIINAVLKIIGAMKLDEAQHAKIDAVKRHLAECRILDKTESSDRAMQFISEIINSHAEVEDSISKLRELIGGDEGSVSYVKGIFGLLIDNYSNLYKLPNSDMLAVFFGELIKRNIFLKPFMKVALHLVKHSLSVPQNEREYAFAFRILEVFLVEKPEFLAEVESIDSVCAGLIRKELVLIDEDSQTLTELDKILVAVLGIPGPADAPGSDGLRPVRRPGQALGGKGTELASSFERSIGGFNTKRGGSKSRVESERLAAQGSEPAPKSTLQAYHIFKDLTADNQDFYVGLVLQQGPAFRDYMTEAGFEILKNCFIYKMSEEPEFYYNLGSFLGMLVVAQNRMVQLETFDFKNFIRKSVEYRRITACVYAVAGFLKQGSRGIVFVPNNPWLMSVMDLLAELYSCTLSPVRKTIKGLFDHFGLRLAAKPACRMKEHLIKYDIPYDGVLRQVIASALDFSVREICNKIVRSSLAVSKVTAASVFSRIIRDGVKKKGVSKKAGVDGAEGFFSQGSKNFFIFRNLYVSLARALIHISAQEPLKASICGNVTHFLKLSMNELAPDAVYQIATSNLKACCYFVEKVGITQVNELALTVYDDLMKDIFADEPPAGRSQSLTISGMADQMEFISNLKIINETNFVEATHVRSIENSEYQEIRSFLIQIGRKMPLKKKDFITEEWPLLLGEQREKHFRNMIAFLETAPDRDMQCLSLCKYLVGHAISTDCGEDFVFHFIVRVLEISHKTKREVVGWLLYSDDCKRHNIPLIRRFVEYDLIYLEEFDQALARSLRSDDYKALNFTLELLTVLILGQIQLCTVYDFIHTIETLNKMNDNPRVFEFFKRIEQGMMKFSEANDASFDTALKTLRLNQPAAAVRAGFNERYTLSLKPALKSAWHHFVLYSGSYRFFKVDTLALLSKDHFNAALRESLALLVQAYAKRHYLFFMFFCRFFIKLLDEAEETSEVRGRIARVLEILLPSSLPGFAAQYIEILDHPFVAKHLARSDAFFIFKDLITLLTVNPRYERLVTNFFVKNNIYSKKYNLYLSYLCPDRFPSLKNLFNQTRSGVAVERGTNPFFLAFYNIHKHIKIAPNYSILIDNLNEYSSSTVYAIDRLRVLLERGINREEIVLTLLIRSAASNVPDGVTLACEELLVRPEAKEIVERYTAKYFADRSYDL